MKRNRHLIKVLALMAVAVWISAGAVIAAEETLTGVVDQNDSGMIIIAADDGEEYIVKGKDLSEMVGRSVKVTGTLAEEADAKTITIMEVEELKE